LVIGEEFNDVVIELLSFEGAIASHPRFLCVEDMATLEKWLE
jgi:hypothetical protein